jgi:hypothetical protein
MTDQRSVVACLALPRPVPDHGREQKADQNSDVGEQLPPRRITQGAVNGPKDNANRSDQTKSHDRQAAAPLIHERNLWPWRRLFNQL